MHAYELLRRPMRLRYRQMLAHGPFTPSPGPMPLVGSEAADADRVIVIGNGPMHGWGVATHGLSAIGQLAAVLSTRSGRAVGVEYVGDERMTIDSVDAWVGDRASAGADLVILAIGLNDALRLTPVDHFGRRYAALVAALRADLPAASQILLLGVPRATRYAMAGGFLGRIAEHHADRMNAAIRRAAEGHDGVTVSAALSERFEVDAPLGSPAFFRDLAEQLADAAAPLLDLGRSGRTASFGGLEPTAAQQRAERGDPALDALVERVKDRFDAAAAAVNLFDGDRVVPAAHTGGVPAQMPGSLVYCGTVEKSGTALLVPDARLDERFRDNPLLDLLQVPFYAGVPLRSPDGGVVGTLCVFDTGPRPADAEAEIVDELRLVAREAELLLTEE